MADRKKRPAKKKARPARHKEDPWVVLAARIAEVETHVRMSDIIRQKMADAIRARRAEDTAQRELEDALVAAYPERSAPIANTWRLIPETNGTASGTSESVIRIDLEPGVGR